VLLGLLASKPANADAVREFVERNNLPVVGTFQSAGALSAHLFQNFGGRVGQLANQPADQLLNSADLVITIGYDPIEYPPLDWSKGNRELSTFAGQSVLAARGAEIRFSVRRNPAAISAML
jgi:acetolactate synthase-1/2/3 large subunit